jgi:hypothetical protein
VDGQLSSRCLPSGTHHSPSKTMQNTNQTLKPLELKLQVRLGDTVTFLPTPLRNWWGRPRLQQAWLGLSIYVIIVMVRWPHLPAHHHAHLPPTCLRSIMLDPIPPEATLQRLDCCQP